MAEPVYDDDKGLDRLTPDAIRELEDKYSSQADEKEDWAIENGADPSDLERKGMGRKLRRRSEAEDEKSEADLNKHLQDSWQSSKEQDEKRIGRGYRRKAADKNLVQRLRDHRRKIIIGSGIATVIIAMLIALFGFLNVFKLDDIMSNIDQKAFARFNAAADRRSDKWIQSYFFLRLTQLKGVSGADPDSEYFRANKIDTNNPIRDWYHTLRTSKFEADLAKNGIVFVNRDAGNGVTFSVLLVDGTQVAGLTPGDVRSGKLVDQLRTNKTLVEGLLSEIDLTQPGGNAAARQKIKSVVNDLARTQSVVRRRQIRKDIQNMTGVRDWRFFETTRDKVDTAKIDIRNKIITAAIPEDTMAGKFVRCLFGIASCRASEDPSDSQFNSEVSLAGEGNPDNPDDPLNGKDANGKPLKTIDFGPAADLIKEIIAKAGLTLNAVNVISTLDSLSHVNSAIENGDISKMVVVARGVQAMGLYQVFETSRDQLKSGDVTSEEVNKFMQVIGPIASSEGWTKVINGNGNPSQLTQTAAANAYCDPKHQAALENNPEESNKEFAYLCPDKQIGGASNATALETAYKGSIGGVLSPILAVYNGFRNAPVIGTVINFLNGVLGKITSLLTSALTDILKVVGLEDNLQSALSWIVGKVAAFLGAGPIMNGNEGAGVYMNWLTQGGAYTAEATARANGAMLTNNQTAAAAQQSLSEYNLFENSQQSLASRIFSSSNPNSVISRAALGISQLRSSSVGSMFADSLKNLSSILTPLGHGALAVTQNGYAAANFAAIQTFDYPQQCYSLDPLTAGPLDGTNALQIFQQNGLAVSSSDLIKLQSWNTETNSLDFYATVYHVIDPNNNKDNDDVIAEQIYNCNLLDNTVRGGLANVYGYGQDNGLD